jgi:hypothetical protein
MKKVFTLLAVMLLMATSMFAQTTQNVKSLSYQAVVRENSTNNLVVSTPMQVEVTILDANNAAQYTETHSVTSNQNGLITLMIGKGTPGNNNAVTFDQINWEGATIQSHITYEGGDVTINSPVNAVPLALQALNANSSDFEQVQADWNQNQATEPDYIKNKPENLVTTNDLNQAIQQVQQNIPTVNDGKLSVKIGNNNPVQIFSANASEDAVITIPAMPDMSNFVTTEALSNAGYLTQESDPSVNDAMLTIKQGTTTLGTFTANAAEPQTINIPEPNIPEIPSMDEIAGMIATMGFLTEEVDPTVKDGKLTFVFNDNEEDNIEFTANNDGDVEVDLSDFVTNDVLTQTVEDINNTIGNLNIPDVSNLEDRVSIIENNYATNDQLSDLTQQLTDLGTNTSDQLSDLNQQVTDLGTNTSNQLDAANQRMDIIEQDYLRKDEVDDYIQTYLDNNLETYLSNYLDQFAIQSSSEVFDVAEDGIYEFEISMVPMDNTAVMFYVNGVMVGTNTTSVISINGTAVTYNSSYNYNYELQAGDKVTIVYVHPAMH